MALRKQRARVRASVAVLRDGKRETVYVENVSEGGLGLQGLAGLRVGEIICIHAKGAVFDAEIRWVDGQSFGVRYHEGQNAGELQRFLSTLPRMTSGKTKARTVFREMGVTRGA